MDDYVNVNEQFRWQLLYCRRNK